MTLGANQLKAQNDRLSWNHTETEFASKKFKLSQLKSSRIQINLKPLEIRTFILTIQTR